MGFIIFLLIDFGIYLIALLYVTVIDTIKENKKNSLNNTLEKYNNYNEHMTIEEENNDYSLTDDIVLQANNAEKNFYNSLRAGELNTYRNKSNKDDDDFIYDLKENDFKQVLKKYLWFNIKEEYFNYFFVYGNKQKLDINSSNIIIIHSMFIRLANELGITIDWLVNMNMFNEEFKKATSWALSHKSANIFSYHPRSKTKEAVKEYEHASFKYRFKPEFESSDTISPTPLYLNEYNKLYDKFEIMVYEFY